MDRLIGIKEMMSLLGKARPTLYKMVKEGRFPEPVKVNNRTQGWTVSQYKNWCDGHTTKVDRHEKAAVADIYRRIEAEYGVGATLAFHDLIEEYERKESSKDK